MPGYIRDGYGRVTPRLITPDVAGLVEFIRAVFAATGEFVPDRPVELRIGDSVIMISDGGGIRRAMARDAGAQVIE